MISIAIRPAAHNQLAPLAGDDRGGGSAGQEGVGSAEKTQTQVGIGLGRVDDSRGEAVIEVAEEEVQQSVRGLRAPQMPTQAEVEHHRICGHLPYRPWCPECVEGFGREWPHRGKAPSGSL